MADMQVIVRRQDRRHRARITGMVRASACSARDSAPAARGLRPAHRLVPLLPRHSHLLPQGLLGLGRPCHRGLPRGYRFLLGVSLRRQRLAQARLGSARLPRIGGRDVTRA
jgi:hypothetical protein